MNKMICADLYKHEIERILKVEWDKELEVERVINNNLEDALSCIKYELTPIQVCLLSAEWKYLQVKFTRDLDGQSSKDIHFAHRLRMVFE